MPRPVGSRNAVKMLVVASLVALSGPARAELFRCEAADGRTIFTDQKGVCPDSEGYEPTGRVHSAPASPRRSRPAARAPAPTEAQAEQAAEQWRQKRRAAEEAVAAVQRQRALLQPSVAHCNRGGYVTARDEAGIKQRLSCNEIKARFNALDAAEAKARAYLAQGLADECRKAGCLPGWIR